MSEENKTKDVKQYFYLLVNPCMPGYVRVHTTDRLLTEDDPVMADKEHYPTSNRILGAIEVDDIKGVKNYFARHDHITTTFKIVEGTPFIETSAEVAFEYLVEASKFFDKGRFFDGATWSTIGTKIRQPFAFSMIGLKPGDEIVFAPTGRVVTIYDDRQVDDNGVPCSLSGYVKDHMPADMRNTSGAYQGPHYFTYKGKKLSHIRNEMEAETRKSISGCGKTTENADD